MNEKANEILDAIRACETLDAVSKVAVMYKDDMAKLVKANSVRAIHIRALAVQKRKELRER